MHGVVLCGRQSPVHVRRIVDLSIVLDPDTQVYPGDPKPAFRPAATIEADGANVLALELGSHSGTHVDAPYHFIADGPRLEDCDPGLFIGPVVIADVRHRDNREPITWEDLAPCADRLGPGVILALQTAWSDRYYRTERYYRHPFLDPEACSRILDLGVRTLAIDALNPDPTEPARSKPEFPVHRLFLSAGGVIAENLTNLSAVDFPDPLLCLFPIRLGVNADGAPCRAVALQLEAG